MLLSFAALSHLAFAAGTPSVKDVLEPLPAGALRLTGGLEKDVRLVRDNWCLDPKMPLAEFEKMYTEGRPVFAMGEMWGKFIRSAAMFNRYERLPALEDRVTNSVNRLIASERRNGSVSCVPPERQVDGPGGDLWERKYVMLAMEGAYDSVRRDPRILASLRRQADAILAQIGDGEGQVPIASLGWSFNHVESATLLEPMMRLWNHTGERRYLDFAKYIIESGGARRYDLFAQARARVKPCEMGGKYPKAYEMLSLFEGAVEYYRATGDEQVRQSVIGLFEGVLARELTIVGNGGGDAPYHYGVLGEAWDDTAYEQTNPRMSRMMETCTGVTWMKFCSQILRLTGDARAGDAIETYVYNGLLGAMKPDGTGFSYVNLLNGAKVTNQGWGYDFGGKPVTCCNLNGPMGIAYIPYCAVMEASEGPSFILYNPMTVKTRKASVSVKTEYPLEGEIAITLDEVREDGAFPIALRIPAWSERTVLEVNGIAEVAPTPGTFVKIRRNWKRGDTIRLALDLRTRLVRAPKGSDPAGWNFESLRRGPVVLARDERSDPDYAAPVKVLSDADGIVAVRRVAPSLPDHRLELEVPVKGGTIRMCDFASVDCWAGTKVTTWLPFEENFASLSTFVCSSEEVNRRFADPAQAEAVFTKYLGAKLSGNFPSISSVDLDQRPLDGVTWAKGTLETRRGPVELAWRLDAATGRVVGNNYVAWGIWGNHGSMDEKGRIADIALPDAAPLLAEMTEGVLRVAVRFNDGRRCVLELPHERKWNGKTLCVASDAVHASALAGALAVSGDAGEDRQLAAARRIAREYYGRSR